jgi:hypothetical protein
MQTLCQVAQGGAQEANVLGALRPNGRGKGSKKAASGLRADITEHLSGNAEIAPGQELATLIEPEVPSELAAPPAGLRLRRDRL